MWGVGKLWIAYLEGHAGAECRRTNRKLIRQGKEHSWWKEKQMQRHNPEKVGRFQKSQVMWDGQGIGVKEGRQRPKATIHHWLST